MREIKEQISRLQGEGWMWKHARVLTMEVPIEPDPGCLPTGLRLTEPRRAMIFVADYPETTFGSVYMEAAVVFRARLGPVGVNFCPWMLVDDDVALILGREYLGYPKKMGEIELVIEGDDLRATVRRKGVTLIEARGTVGSEDPTPPPFIAGKLANAWGPIGLTLQRLLGKTASEEIHQAHHASVELAIQDSEYDPISEFRIGPIQEARLYDVSFGGGGMPIPLIPIDPSFVFRNWALRFG